MEWVNSNRIDGSYLVLGSDMNCVHWPSDRSTNKIDSISKALRYLNLSLDVKDVWRFFHPDTNDFTYIDPSTGGINSRIDVMCVCPQLKTYVQSCVHKTTPCLTTRRLVCLEHNYRERVKRCWKFKCQYSKLGQI